MSEPELLRQLALQFHLSVPDRKELPDGLMNARLFCVEVCHLLLEHLWYPVDWRPDSQVDGGVIELQPNGSCRIHWRAQLGLHRFETVEVQDFATSSAAVMVWLREMYPEDIDGIRLNWE